VLEEVLECRTGGLPGFIGYAVQQSRALADEGRKFGSLSVSGTALTGATGVSVALLGEVLGNPPLIDRLCTTEILSRRRKSAFTAKRIAV
jgi:hypothetical protein